MNKEIYCNPGDANLKPDDVFGYQEAWAEYRYIPNRVSGYFAPNSSNTLASWNYSQVYSSQPKLSASWLIQGSEELKRTLVVQSDSAQFLADILFTGSMTRPMPVYSIPGLMDHH